MNAAPHHLHIDVETFSSATLQKSGVYRYAESKDFTILLFAYSLDGGPVEIIDLAQWAPIPPHIVNALTDPAYIKHAYNAAFEITCLSKFLGPLPADQWRCTMLHGLYFGYPAGLEAIGKALGLPSDKQKLTAGKALIKYFSVPCSSTKTNGGRTRNLPQHDPAKWELFKEYCKGDVAAEMTILDRFINFPVPDEIQKQWVTDYNINSRGVAVDMDLVDCAVWIGASTRGELMAEAEQISGLENPNSREQLKNWLEEELDEDLPDVRKDTIKNLLRRRELDSAAARRMLEIRRELGKTSTKKYNAIEATVCEDGRVRGLLQFYGANRTGRWAGRLVQVQNLPRTYTEPLPLARDLIKGYETPKLRVLYGSVPETLSQLIRTAFIASPGHVLIDADFSSIEARIVAWLAGEEWKLDVFRTHGRIYEASASQMFGVPMEKITKGNPEYELRQKGKIAELALGYQGSTGALKKMGALDMGLKEEELPEIVSRWREANKRIRDLWYKLEAAAVSVTQNSIPVGVNGLMLAREADFKNKQDFLVIRLPSGRKLYYAKPYVDRNQWDNPAMKYLGVNQTTKKWDWIETYGGRLVENVTQAIARDCLAEAIERLETAGYRTGYGIVMHVHDEIIIECPEEKADLDAVTMIMAAPLPWAPDLPMGADGWIGEFYRKG